MISFRNIKFDFVIKNEILFVKYIYNYMILLNKKIFAII